MKDIRKFLVESIKPTRFNKYDNEEYVDIYSCLIELFEFNETDEGYLLILINEYNSVYKALTDTKPTYNYDYIWKTILEIYKNQNTNKIDQNEFLNIVKQNDKELTNAILNEYKNSIKELNDELKEYGKLN